MDTGGTERPALYISDNDIDVWTWDTFYPVSLQIGPIWDLRYNNIESADLATYAVLLTGYQNNRPWVRPTPVQGSNGGLVDSAWTRPAWPVVGGIDVFTALSMATDGNIIVLVGWWYVGTPPYNTYLAVLTSPVAATPAGINWTYRPIGGGSVVGELRHVHFQGAYFIATGNTNNSVWQSYDGINWTQKPQINVGANVPTAISNWGGRLILGCGDQIWYSDDAATTWNLATGDYSDTWIGHTITAIHGAPVGPGLTVDWNYVAVGTSDTVLHSADKGLTWTEIFGTFPAATEMYALTYDYGDAYDGNGYGFIAGGGNWSTTKAYISTSPDGITWTERLDDIAVGSHTDRIVCLRGGNEYPPGA
jgi:hypothetical protein